MILNVFTIAMLLVITGLWCTSQKGRGFFSAFLSMICVISAGAIAFGVWEPLTMLILQYGGSNGLVERIAPTAGLLLPFCVALGLLRLVMDSIVGANADFDDATNFIGGLVCGMISAVITTGTVLVALNFLGVGKTLMGHDAIDNDAGNLVAGKPLWVPADRITVALYERLSTAGFASSTPLAIYAPALHEQAAMSRQLHQSEKGNKVSVGRSSMDPSDRTLQIKGRMTVTGELRDLLTDRWFPDRTHIVKTVDGQPPANGSSAEIIFLQVDSSGAAEDSGQVVFTPGQIRLIARRGNSDGVAIHPHAVFAKADQNATSLTRFRFDDTNRLIASPGRGGNHAFGFEFLVPAGYTPDSIIVRNIRRSLRNVPSYNETGGPIVGASARDNAVAFGNVVTALNISMGGIDLPPPTGQPVATDNPTNQNSPTGLTPILPAPYLQGVPSDRAMGLVIADQTFGRSSRVDKVIRSGRATFSADEISGVGARSQLRARSFEQPADQRVVMVELKKRGETRMSVFGQAVQQIGTNGQPLLYDRNTGKYFQAYGFVHAAGNNVTIQYDFTRPIRNMADNRQNGTGLPSMEMDSSDASIHLVFLVDRSADITDFVINLEGESAPRFAVRFSPSIPRGN